MTDPVPILETTAIFSDGVDQITATAVVGVDLSQKGMQTSQQFGAASSYGKKYALGNLFLIDDTADSDSTNKHGKDAPAPKQKVEKTELKGNDLEKAKAYIQGGGNIEAIKQKYKLSSEIESELTKL